MDDYHDYQKDIGKKGTSQPLLIFYIVYWKQWHCLNMLFVIFTNNHYLQLNQYMHFTLLRT